MHYSDSRNEAHLETETNAQSHFNLLISPKLYFFCVNQGSMRMRLFLLFVMYVSDDDYNATHSARKLKLFSSA